MPSDALKQWNTERSKALDSLDNVHGSVTGRRVGRQYATKHYNLTMYVALAAEFQGFCRDLHDDTAAALLWHVPSSTGPLIPIFLNSLTRGRQLDRGNAQAKSLGSDFQILGIRLWPELEALRPRSKQKWHDTLESLNKIRNAVAHSNQAALDELRREMSLDLRTWRRTRSTLNQLAPHMDKVAFNYVQQLTGSTPW